jgi:hypothetical protein
MLKAMNTDEGSQGRRFHRPVSESGRAGRGAAGGLGRWETVLPNPKLKLLDQVREVMRVKHYAIRTEQCHCDWIRRYVRFHTMHQPYLQRSPQYGTQTE